VTDQGSEASTATEGEAPKVTETPTEAVDVEALKAEIAADYTAKIEERERDNAKLREKLRAAKEADEATKLKAGDYEPLIEERDSTIAELRAQLAELEPDAKARREWVKAEEASIAKAAEDLDEEGRAIVAALPLDQKRAAIAKLGGVRTTEARPPEHPAANPSTVSNPGFENLSDEARADAIKRDPKGWAAHVAKSVAGGLTSWDRRKALARTE